MNGMLWISQVQWYSLGDTLSLFGAGVLVGAIGVGLLVSIFSGKSSHKDPERPSLGRGYYLPKDF